MFSCINRIFVLRDPRNPQLPPPSNYAALSPGSNFSIHTGQKSKTLSFSIYKAQI